MKIETLPFPKPLLVVLVLLLLIVYGFSYNGIRVAYIDDTWSYSWAWNFVESGEVFDPVFGYLDGDGGTALFGRTYAYLYGAWGSLTNWSRPWAYLLSTILLLGSLVLWRIILRKLGYTPRVIYLLLVVMLLLEAYLFGIAHRLRSDSLIFFLSTLSVLLFFSDKPLWSALALSLAVEVHPYGMAGLCFISAKVLADWISNRKFPLSRKTVLLFCAGAALGVIYYLILHYQWLGGVSSLKDRLTGTNPTIQYFFGFSRYTWRRWPLLAMIVISIIVFFLRKEYRNELFAPLSAVAVILFSLALPRGSEHYFAFLAPPFLLLIAYVADRFKLTTWLLVAFLAFQIPQYAWLFWSKKDFSWPSYLQRIEESVPEDEEIFIYGPSSAWFALKDRDFHAYGYFTRAGDNIKQYPERMYVIRNERIEVEGGVADLEALAHAYTVRDVLAWEESGYLEDLGSSNFLVQEWVLNSEQAE